MDSRIHSFPNLFPVDLCGGTKSAHEISFLGNEPKEMEVTETESHFRIGKMLDINFGDAGKFLFLASRNLNCLADQGESRQGLRISGTVIRLAMSRELSGRLSKFRVWAASWEKCIRSPGLSLVSKA